MWVSDFTAILESSGLMFGYLPRSEVGSLLTPLLGRRTLPRDRPRPGLSGEEEPSTGACSDDCEESFRLDCQRSEFDHLEPLLEVIDHECQ